MAKIGTFSLVPRVKNFELDWSVNYKPKSRKTQFLEMQLLGMLTSRIFAGLSPLTSKINPENFRLISQRLAILQNNL